MVLLLVLLLGTVTACTGSGGSGTAKGPETRPDAKPSPGGGTYKGKVQRGYEISFDLPADGNEVTKVAANVLEMCEGSSGSRTTQLYWDGPFTVGPDGTVAAEGEDPEFEGIEFRFTAKFAGDGTAAGTVLQKGAGCTTYELEWAAERE